MIELVVFAGIAVTLLLLMLWAAHERGGSQRPPQVALEPPLEEMFAMHSRHFPQIRQALSRVDEEYLRQRGTPKIVRQARTERCRVARQFLAGLEDDFSRLNRLGRTVAALSPEVNRKQEFERVWLWLRFWILCRLVSVSLRTGRVSIPQIAHLTQLVGSLAAEIETAMAGLEAASGKRLGSSLNA